MAWSQKVEGEISALKEENKKAKTRVVNPTTVLGNANGHSAPEIVPTQGGTRPPQPPQSAASSSSAVAVGVQGRGVAQPRVVHPPPLEIPATEDRVPPQSGQQLQGGEPNLQDVLQETLLKFQKMLNNFGNGRNTRANPFEIPNPPAARPDPPLSATGHPRSVKGRGP